MARRKKKKQQDETLVDIVEVGGQAQDFVSDNQTTIFGGLTILVLLIGGIFAYNNFYKAPQMEEATNQMAEAQFQFERDSFASGLTNPGGGFSGFLDIMDSYGSTDAGNAAELYSGISYLHLGKYDAAIDFLKGFSASGQIAPILKNGTLGDAYSEKGEFDTALGYYKKAANSGEIDILNAYYLKKYGMLNEKQGNTAEALEAYKTLKQKYAETPDGRDIDKNIVKLGG